MGVQVAVVAQQDEIQARPVRGLRDLGDGAGAVAVGGMDMQRPGVIVMPGQAGVWVAALASRFASRGRGAIEGARAVSRTVPSQVRIENTSRTRDHFLKASFSSLQESDGRPSPLLYHGMWLFGGVIVAGTAGGPYFRGPRRGYSQPRDDDVARRPFSASTETIRAREGLNSLL